MLRSSAEGASRLNRAAIPVCDGRAAISREPTELITWCALSRTTEGPWAPHDCQVRLPPRTEVTPL